MPPYLTTNSTAPVDFSKVQQNPNLPTQYPTAQPITTLSSISGGQIANDSIKKLQGMQSAYAGPSIVDYLSSIGQANDLASRGKLAKDAGIKDYQGSAEQNTQLLNLLRAPTNNPAQSQIVSSINQSIQGGGAQPSQIQSYSNAQDLQGMVFNDMSLAEAAKQDGDYGQMDYLIKRAEENNKKLQESLTQLYSDLKPAREQQLALLTPGAKEQQLAQSANDLKTQIDQFKLQTEEDKFREFEGQTMGFAGGRANEIDIRAEFKLQRMNLELSNVFGELGIEQEIRKAGGEAAKITIDNLLNDFELQTKVQDRLSQEENDLFDRVRTLTTDAQDTLGILLDSLEGTNPDELNFSIKQQLSSLAAQARLPYDVLEQGLKTQYAQSIVRTAISGGAGTPSTKYTATNIPTTLRQQLVSDIQAGFSLDELYSAYEDVSSSYISSEFNKFKGGSSGSDAIDALIQQALGGGSQTVSPPYTNTPTGAIDWTKVQSK